MFRSGVKQQKQQKEPLPDATTLYKNPKVHEIRECRNHIFTKYIIINFGQHGLPT